VSNMPLVESIGTFRESAKAETPVLRSRQASLSPDAVRGLPVPQGPGGNAPIWITIGGLAALILALCTFRVDIVVEAPGRVSTHDSAIELQPFDRALVRRIHVTPGQIVDTGALLVEFDPAQTRSALHRAEQQVMSLEAEHERLNADLEDRNMQSTGSAASRQQDQVLASQRHERQFRRDSFSQQEQRASGVQASATQQLEILDRRHQSALTMMRGQEQLNLQGLSTTMQLDNVRQQIARIEQERLDWLQRLSGATLDLQTTRTDRERWQAELHVTARSRLTEVERLLVDAHRDLQEAITRARLNETRAPFRAVVLDIANHGSGSVAGAGEMILRLTRTDAPIYVEMDVEPSDAVWVRPNLDARIEFLGLPVQRHGQVAGRVDTVTPNSIDRGALAQPGAVRQNRIHRAYVAVDPSMASSLKNVPVGFRPSPGHEVIVRVKIGERAPIHYITDVLFDASNGAFGGR
jgi:HlyD family type I secretion membrane fusion protein